MTKGARCVLIGVGLLALAHALGAAPAAAQIVLDGSLKPENAGVTPPVVANPGCTLPNPPVGTQFVNYEVDAGLGVLSGTGKNLFHSFDKLSLGLGDCLTFTGPSSVQSLVARVTGGEQSTIQGILRSELENADLYLVNPAGIRFVRPDLGAETPIGDIISVRQSFYASTADQLAFSDGRLFASLGGGDDPVTIDSDPAAWGFLGGGAAGISVETADLRVVVLGERIGLAAGDVLVRNAGGVIADGGEIDLAAVGTAAMEVPLRLEDLDAAAMEGAALGEVRVDGASLLRTGATGPSDPMGRVVVRSGRLVVAEFSTVWAGADSMPGQLAIDVIATESVELSGVSNVTSLSYAPEGAGEIRIESPRVELRDPGTRLQLFAPAGGSAGTLRVESDEVVVRDGAYVRSRAADIDRGGDILIEADRIEVADGGVVQSLTTGRARGGDVILDGTTIEVRGGGQVIAQTTSDGRSGDVTAIASEHVRIAGAGGDPGSPAPSAIVTRSGEASTAPGIRGDAGNVRIDTPVLEMTGPSLVSASSVTSGRSGVIRIGQSDAEGLPGKNGSVRLIGDASGAPEISTRTFDGNGGGVDEEEPGLLIENERLELRNGAAIASSTRGRGRAADIRIDAGTVEMAGLGASGQTAGVFAESLSPDSIAEGEGGSGRIVVEARRVDVLRGAELSIETQGPGAGQSIEIMATDTVRILGGTVRSNASAQASARAGDLVIHADGDIVIRDGGLVTARSERPGSDFAPDAGDITLEAGGSVEIAGSVVETGADAASGGRIEIRAGDRVDLFESRVETSVEGGLGDDDAGDITLAAGYVAVNRSEVLADATLGDGGNILITAAAYLESADSTVRASSRFGLDGEILIEAPDSELVEQGVRLPAQFLDAATLLRSQCAARAREQGSFVLAGMRGAPVDPARPLAAPMPLPGDPAEARGETVGVAPAPEAVQLAIAPEDCEGLVRAQEASAAERRRGRDR